MRKDPWIGVFFDTWSLGIEASSVIAARIMKLTAGGDASNTEARRMIAEGKNVILHGAKYQSDKVRRILSVYDNAYASLIERRDPGKFREFLLSAPELFLEIGEKMGAMTHLTSFWQYRFPPGSPKSADPDELTTIFEDFMRSFGKQAMAA